MEQELLRPLAMGCAASGEAGVIDVNDPSHAQHAGAHAPPQPPAAAAGQSPRPQPDGGLLPRQGASGSTQAAFNRFDKDGTGLISRDELRDALADIMGLELPEDEVLNMIHGTDMDKDGKLNFTEFQMLVGKFGGAAAGSGGAAPEPAPAMGRTISGRAATTNEDSVSRIQRLRREAVNRGPNLDLNPRLKKPRDATAPRFPPASCGFEYTFELEQKVMGMGSSDGRPGTEVVRWYWAGDEDGGHQNKWVVYDDEQSARIEAAFQAKQDRCDVSDRHHVDLKNLLQRVTAHPDRRRRVNRGDPDGPPA